MEKEIGERCRDRHRHRDREKRARKGEKGRERDRKGQRGTERDRKGQKGTSQTHKHTIRTPPFCQQIHEPILAIGSPVRREGHVYRVGCIRPFARFTRADRILSLILSPISQHGLADVTLCSPLALHTSVSADGSSKAEGTAAAKRGVAAAKV